MISSFDESNLYLENVHDNIPNLIAIRLHISNPSSTAFTITGATLKHGSELYEAIALNIKDRRNSNGVTLIEKKPKDINTIDAIYLNISSENLFNNPRLEPNSSSYFYVTFEDVAPLHKFKEFELTLFYNKKRFSTKVTVNLPPKDLDLLRQYL
ncbi:hypothetical protein [Clostridium baratii]|uniref:hypothetical protein n=1 Tax=Clostridium baratii TaxID=1561 RepID=UPI0030D1704C